MSVKGTWPRPFANTREERELRKELMYGEITEEEFNKRYKRLQKRGLIKRNGRVV
jgi:DNA-binding Lrp family transcriptional regulator